MKKTKIFLAILVISLVSCMAFLFCSCDQSSTGKKPSQGTQNEEQNNTDDNNHKDDGGNKKEDSGSVTLPAIPFN